jgi:hypothetical protein
MHFSATLGRLTLDTATGHEPVGFCQLGLIASRPLRPLNNSATSLVAENVRRRLRSLRTSGNAKIQMRSIL